jgi:hypothetical protein
MRHGKQIRNNWTMTHKQSVGVPPTTALDYGKNHHHFYSIDVYVVHGHLGKNYVAPHLPDENEVYLVRVAHSHRHCPRYNHHS